MHAMRPKTEKSEEEVSTGVTQVGRRLLLLLAIDCGGQRAPMQRAVMRRTSSQQPDPVIAGLGWTRVEPWVERT